MPRTPPPEGFQPGLPPRPLTPVGDPARRPSPPGFGPGGWAPAPGPTQASPPYQPGAWAPYPPSPYPVPPSPYPPPPPLPPPGWYRDPGGVHQFRFWGGMGWTPGVANGPWVTQDWPGGAHPPAEPDTRANLAKPSLFTALGGIAAGLALALLGSLLAAFIAPGNRLALLVLSQAGLWSGLLSAVWLGSHRYGTGNIWRDFGVRIRGEDVGWGVLISIIGRIAGLVLVVPLVSISSKFAGSDVKPLQVARSSPALLVALVLIALVGAPFIEELFFRGLLQRSLVPLAGRVGAIACQAVIFASLHMKPSYGLGNLSLFAAIGAMGLVQGWVADHYKRLGPGIFSHAFFNLVAVLVVVLR